MPALQTTRFTSKRLLVVDDEERLAESLAALLRGVGYKVRHATSGMAGLALLRAEHFDLLITDLRMNEVDGFDLMRHVTDHHPHMGIIVITGHATTESAIEALHQRVADYIPKPFDFDLLKASIEKVFTQQEADQLRRDFARLLSHDIKAPITGILGFAQLIVSDNPKLRRDPIDCATRIINNCHKVLAMLDNYLTNARQEEGRLEIDPAPVDPAALLDEALANVAIEIQRKSIEVRREIQPLTATLHADENLLARALGNLITNAAKYAPNEAWIQVAVRPHGPGEVSLEVANSGAHLEPGEIPGLFDRYRRAGSSRGIDGNGLGLHVVRIVAEAHGGRADCHYDAAQKIVCFRMVLPVNPPPRH
jgi:signal transduction histidine kinase